MSPGTCVSRGLPKRQAAPFRPLPENAACSADRGPQLSAAGPAVKGKRDSLSGQKAPPDGGARCRAGRKLSLLQQAFGRNRLLYEVSFLKRPAAALSNHGFFRNSANSSLIFATSMGLAMCPFMPAANACCLSSSKAFAVMAIIGISLWGPGSARILPAA